MTDTNIAAIRVAAQALVRQAEPAGVVVTIETVPKTPLAMGSYDMQVGVRQGRGRRHDRSLCGAGGLTEQDAGLLEQGASMLEELAVDERKRGNDPVALGAECSAHAVRRLAVALMAPVAGLAAELREIAAEQRDPEQRGFSHGPAEIARACELAAWHLHSQPQTDGGAA